MKCVSKNAFTYVYYHSHQLETGLDVVFSFWDQDGTLLEADRPADSEISDCGVYYTYYLTPDVDQYILVKASLSGGGYPKGFVMKAGNPSAERVYYAAQDFTEALSINYEVFDEVDSSLALGLLTEVGEGFYYADVTSLLKPWYFQVGSLILPDRACT